MSIIRKLILFTALSILLITQFSEASKAAQSIKKEQYRKPICRIEIDNAHISQRELRFDSRRAVIVKARSICNVAQNQVTLTVNIYKVEKFGHPLLQSVSTDPKRATSSGKIVKNYDALVDCKNFKRTKFYGIAYSKALINGQWNYAGRTRSIKIIEINCGT
jgi:hypothetical protein